MNVPQGIHIAYMFLQDILRGSYPGLVVVINSCLLSFFEF
jgi:hypothetical protein